MTQDDLEHFLDLLPGEPAGLVRKDKHFKDLGLIADDYTTREAVVTLVLEALSLSRAARPTGASASLLSWARIKAASYPLQMVHPSLGAGGLTFLLRRRTGMELAAALGVVMLILLFDLAALLVLATVGATFATNLEAGGSFELRAGIATALVGALALGLAALRAPISLGPLDRLRDAQALRAAREAPLQVLAELALIRLLLVSCFIALGAAALWAFGVSIPIGNVAVGILGVALVAAIPIAVSGLGTSQVAFVAVFGDYAGADTLLACSLSLSLGLLVVRSGLGLVFAREFTREALRGALADAERAATDSA